MHTKTDLLEGNILKSLILFAIPLIISNLFQQLYNAADTMIVVSIFWVMNRWQQSVHVQRFMNCW